MVSVNGHETETGCYVDGHWGQYGPDRVEEIAENFGYELTDDDNCAHWRIVADSADDADNHDKAYGAWEAHMECADAAEEWLNEHTEDGYSWGWNDGEFFLMPDAWWQEDWDGLGGL